MKTRSFLFLFIFSLIGILNAQTHMEYNSMWKTVDTLLDSSLPSSALEEINKIYEKGIKEKNSPQIVKALLKKTTVQQIIDKGSSTTAIREIENYLQSSSDPAEKSLLYSILAGMYKDYFQSNRYIIMNRTNISGYVPENIAEWPASTFLEKITEYIRLSVKEEKVLYNTDALIYKDIFTEGEDSRIYRPTLYDFIIHQDINTLSSLLFTNNSTENDEETEKDYLAPANRFLALSLHPTSGNIRLQILLLYQEILRFHSSDSSQEAFLMADLERLDFAYQYSQTEARDSVYLSSLEKLEESWKGKNISVEILFRKAQFYLNQPVSYNENSENRKQQENNKNRKAYEIAREGIEKYPGYYRINLLENLISQITQGVVTVVYSNSMYPDSALKLKINYRNIPTLDIKVYKLQVNEPIQKNYQTKSLYKEYGKIEKEIQVTFPKIALYESRDTLISIPIKDPGIYEYVLSTEDKTQSEIFIVTRLATLARNITGENTEILVTDRISGKPVENAKVAFYENVYSKQPLLKATASTDKNGLAVFSGKNDIQGYEVTYGDNKTFLTELYSYYRNSEFDTKLLPKVSVFTDRSLYRPGQTVFFKGIAWSAGENNSQVLPDESYEVIFRDANGQELSKKTYKTNEFGSFAGEFTIPEQLLSGNFSIEVSNSYAYFTVAEYKRPNFKIDFRKNESTYRFGDSIQVKGNVTSFSGIPIQEVKINYRVIRRPHYLFRFFPPGKAYEKQIAAGSERLNEDGSFTFSFLAEKEKNDPWNNTFYQYEIIASVTDINGETQENNQVISVGDKSMYLTINLPDKINKKSAGELRITAKNLSDVPIRTNGSYTIYSLKDISSLKELNMESEADIVYESTASVFTIDKEITSGNFSTSENIPVNWQTFPSGRYRIIANASDNYHQEITQEQDFILYSDNDKRPPVISYNWFIPGKTEVRVGEKSSFTIGSSAGHVYVLYEIFEDDKLLERKRFELNNENKKIEIVYKPEYGNQITVLTTFIKDEKTFTNTMVLRKERENNLLDIKLDVFRDKLLPGQKEEWKLTVKDDKLNGILAEVLAGMYDASLDKLQFHEWYFSPYPVDPYRNYQLTEDQGFRKGITNLYLLYKNKEVPVLKYDQAISSMATYSRMSGRASGGLSMEVMETASLADDRQSMLFAPPVPLAKNNSSLSETAVSTNSGGNTAIMAQPQIRKNFNETAFFYPQLKTNEKGETLLSFTVPESNTTWKFMSIAHTKDLKFGKLIAEAVTQKELMVIPNIPRFLRQGDRTTISTKIANISDKELTGTVRIEWFNPETGTKIEGIKNQRQSFTIPASQTTSASWEFTVPENPEIIGCRIIAETATMSDGEQHLLAILPNRILITESIPLNIRGNSTKEYTLEKLLQNYSSTLINYRFIVEFTENPIWYAVQALPTLSNPSTDNAVSWFASYYVNTLAGHITKENPEIKSMIDIWKKQTDKATLTSALEKNKDVKSVLLEETPWVTDAKNETEQKQQLSLLFDVNRQNQLTEEAIRKIQDLQYSDGGWSWYKGMYSDRYITTFILENMARLTKVGAVEYDENIKRMQIKALNYLDEEIKRDYQRLTDLKRDLTKDRQIGDIQMYYLCVRSYYMDIPILSGALPAYNFYAQQAEKYSKDLTLFGKAQTALFFHKTGKKNLANELLLSLKEYSRTTEEMGMFWPSNQSGYFWNQSPVIVQTAILEAFEEISSNQNKKEIEEMQIWLLKQKQTQAWDAVPSTVNAIYALLLNNNEKLSSGSNSPVNIQAGTTFIDFNTREAGTGYSKKVFDKQEISSDMGNIIIKKETPGIGWGAVYWQYFENIEHVTQQTGSLSLQKKVFMEQTTQSGTVIKEVNNQNLLKTGDKAIIRLTVTTDRDMQYVQLKDTRAACFEPLEQLSGSKWKEGLVYYQELKDASTNFYFDFLPKGTYVFEYPVWINRPGEYSTGIATVQCLYAPEFTNHTSGERIIVTE